jgi:hypothetical protein
MMEGGNKSERCNVEIIIDPLDLGSIIFYR